MSIREMLIERIREIRTQRDKALSRYEIAMHEDMLALNLRIYYNIFKEKV